MDNVALKTEAKQVEWYDEDARDLRRRIAEVVRKKRAETGLIPWRMFQEHDVSYNMLRRAEKGQRVEFEGYAKIAEAFGMTLRELLLEACK